jgi:predicted DNA-binding transcriptional regulator YafY
LKKGRPAKKYSQAGRVHDVIRLVEARHGITLGELAEETGVARRTIQRDLIAIQEAGYPLDSEWQEGEKLYRFLTRFKDVPPIAFSLQEIMSLFFLRSSMSMLAGTPFDDDMETIFKKVKSVLPPRYAAHLERIATVSLPLLQGRRDYRKVAEPLRLLREALLYQRQVTITYIPKGTEKSVTYLVDPFTLIIFKGGLYLMGYAHKRNALRTFAAERIIHVEIGKDRFEIPESFKLEDQLQSAFGIVEEQPMKVKIRFSPVVAPTVRDRLWHPSQCVEENDDGSVLLSFEAGGRMEIISWLLSYGKHAEVIEPLDLREEVKQNVMEMVQIYAS